MSYKVETITNFRKEAKKLIQKYPSLTTEIENIGIFTDLNTHHSYSFITISFTISTVCMLQFSIITPYCLFVFFLLSYFCFNAFK